MSSRTSSGGPEINPGFASGTFNAGARGSLSGAFAFGGKPVNPATSAPGGMVTCTNGDGANGGDVYIDAGVGTAGQNQDGGAIDIGGGNASGSGTSGGNFAVRAGNSSSAGNGAAGTVTVISGTCRSGPNPGGIMSILAGDSISSDPASNGGDAILRSGNSTSGSAGTATIQGGNGQVGGSVTLEGGIGSTTDGGSIVLTPGNGAPKGEIDLNGNLKADAAGIRFSINTGLTGTSHVINFSPSLASVPRCVQLSANASAPVAFNITNASSLTLLQFDTSVPLVAGDEVYLLVIL